MKRSLWLLVVLLSVASTVLIAQPNPVSCTLPNEAKASGKDVSLTCPDVPGDAKVDVVLKSASGQKSDTLPGTVHDKTVTFTPQTAGTYSVSVTVNQKSIDVAGQLKVEAPASVSCDKLPNVAPEQALTLTSCSGLSEQDGTILFKRPDAKDLNAAGQVDSKNKTLKFQIPSEAKGLYSLTVGGKPIDRQLNVMEPVEMTAIYPGTTYQGRKGFDFTIAGKNFSDAPAAGAGEPPTGNLIEIVGGGMLRKCKAETPSAQQYPCATDIGSTTNEIAVTGFIPKHYYGPVNIVVHVGKSASKPISVTFAQVSQPGVVLAAAAVFFVVAYVLYRLVTKGLKADIVDGVKPTPWTSLFLDRETNSYSLSKFQVVAWTAVTVYSYVYLFLCRTLIQGDFRFPDVSQNLPQLFFVSAGTTVAAAAITASVGSKGAGPIQPSAADFISTGGLVAGDRFQFFTWTIVGCIGYLYLVIRMNPETPNISLPDIPQNFLYLMGVSSAGYLGGKIVRKPGPVIKVLSVAKVTPPSGAAPAAPPAPPTPNAPSGAPAAAVADGFQTDARNALGADYAPKDKSLKIAFPVLTLNLRGENLDPTGKIKVDDNPLRGDMFWINGQPDPQSTFCSDMSVSLNDATQYIEGTKTHTLMLVNTDGQSATMTFPIDPMSFDPISVTAGSGAVDVPVTGKNFVDGMKFEWKNPADTKAEAKVPTGSGSATFNSGTRLVVNLTPGTIAGTGKLTFISPIGLRATADVAVT